MLLLSPSRWWILLVQASLNAIFSLTIFLFQDQASPLVVWVFGIMAVLNGLIGGGAAVRERHFLQHWWLNIIIAVINLGMGVFILWYNQFVRGVSLGFLSVFIGIQALFQGSMGFGVSLEMNNKLKIQGAFLFYGILSTAGGILVLAVPYALTLDLLNLIAIYALLAGIGQALDSLRLKRMVH